MNAFFPVFSCQPKSQSSLLIPPRVTCKIIKTRTHLSDQKRNSERAGLAHKVMRFCFKFKRVKKTHFNNADSFHCFCSAASHRAEAFLILYFSSLWLLPTRHRMHLVFFFIEARGVEGMFQWRNKNMSGKRQAKRSEARRRAADLDESRSGVRMISVWRKRAQTHNENQTEKNSFRVFSAQT